MEKNINDAKSKYDNALELSKSKQTDEIIYTALSRYYQQVGDLSLLLKIYIS